MLDKCRDGAGTSIRQRVPGGEGAARERWLPGKVLHLTECALAALPPSVQKNATLRSRALLAIRYDRTGEDTEPAHTGVPITTKS